MTDVRTLWGPGSVGPIATYTSAQSGHTLSNSTNKVANKFILPKSGTIDTVGFLITAKSGTPPAYNVAVVTLDSSGYPTTTAYGSSAVQSYTPTATGWKWVTLSTPATAVAGDACAAIVYPSASTPDGSNNIEVFNVEVAAPGVGMYNNYSSWTLLPYSTAMAVRYSDGTVWGYALTSKTLYQLLKNSTTPDEAGMKFTLPADMTCFGARFTNNYYGWGYAATFDVVLYDNTNSVVASCSVSDKDFVAAASGTAYVNVFWAGASLTAGSTYRIVVKPTTDSGGDINLTRWQLDSAAAMAMLPCGDTWQGTSRTDAGSWTDVTTDMYPLALWVSSMTFSAGGGGGEYAYIG